MAESSVSPEVVPLVRDTAKEIAVKHLKRATDGFITSHCGQSVPQSVGSVDLKAIAEKDDVGELLKVL